MKKIVRLFAIAGAALLMVSCARTSAQDAGDVAAGGASAPADPHAHHASNALPADSPLPGMSLYQLESEWTDQHGRVRQLAELRGRPQAIAMVYTHCGSACPRIVMDLKKLESRFPELGLVLVSIDPERDTPGRLLEFANGSRMGERWTLLAGNDDAIVELAAVLGVRYRRVSPEDFMHSTVISVLDPQGEIVHRQEALGEVDGTVAAVRSMASGGN